jgi:hypothetical protein
MSDFDPQRRGLDPTQQTAAEREAFRAESDRQLDVVVEAVMETHPDANLNPHAFLSIARTLEGGETEAGVYVTPTVEFAETLRSQVASFLDDPEQLINDGSVARYAAQFFTDSAEHRIDYPIAHAYADMIGTSLGNVMLHAELKDLKPPYVDQWFSAVDAAKEPETAADLVRRSGILQRTLSKVVRKNPADFIDRLHAVGMRGLQPDDAVSTGLALGIITDVLESDAMAACSLMQGSFFVEDPRKAGMQQKAMDLVVSLIELLGMDMKAYYSAERYNQELESRDRHLLERHLVPVTPTGRVDMKTWQARTPEQAAEARSQFIVQKANTKDGATNTIYGRIAHHRRRHSFIGRLSSRLSRA